jgi:hypothetical protein
MQLLNDKHKVRIAFATEMLKHDDVGRIVFSDETIFNPGTGVRSSCCKKVDRDVFCKTRAQGADAVPHDPLGRNVLCALVPCEGDRRWTNVRQSLQLDVEAALRYG